MFPHADRPFAVLLAFNAAPDMAGPLAELYNALESGFTRFLESQRAAAAALTVNTNRCTVAPTSVEVTNAPIVQADYASWSPDVLYLTPITVGAAVAVSTMTVFPYPGDLTATVTMGIYSRDGVLLGSTLPTTYTPPPTTTGLSPLATAFATPPVAGGRTPTMRRCSSAATPRSSTCGPTKRR